MKVALRTEHRASPAAFETAIPVVIKEQRAAAVVEPEHPEEESDVADARGDKRLFRRGGGARVARIQNPIEQIRGEPDQFPANEEQEQTVRDDHAEHCAGENER